MAQAGLVGKWHRDEVSNFKMKQSAAQRREGQEEVLNMGQNRVTVKPLALDHLQVYKFFSCAGHSYTKPVCWNGIWYQYFPVEQCSILWTGLIDSHSTIGSFFSLV